MRLFSIQDLKAGDFAPPFAAKTEGVALRMVRSWMASPDLPLAKFPADYALWECGEFDEETGRLSPGDLRHICSLAVIEEHMSS